jgi:hypothetical protein
LAEAIDGFAEAIAIGNEAYADVAFPTMQSLDDVAIADHKS